MQWIIIANDGTDKDALKRRMAVRDEHVKLGDKLHAQGNHLIGAAMLSEEEDMVGSVLIVDFPTEKELHEWLKNEPFVTGNVWDEVQIIPCKVGPSFIKTLAKKDREKNR